MSQTEQDERTIRQLADEERQRQQQRTQEVDGAGAQNGDHRAQNAAGGADVAGADNNVNGNNNGTRPPQPAGRAHEVLANVVSNAIAPLAAQLQELRNGAAAQPQATAAKAVTIASPELTALAASAAADRLAKKRKLRKHGKASSSSSSDYSDSSDEDKEEKIKSKKMLLDSNELRDPSDPVGLRKQVHRGYMLGSELVLMLLSDCNRKECRQARRVAALLASRGKAGLELSSSVAPERGIGLTAADMAFSSLCQNNAFSLKGKELSKAIEVAGKEALQRSAPRSGGAGGSQGQGGSRDEKKDERRDERGKGYERRYEKERR